MGKEYQQDKFSNDSGTADDDEIGIELQGNLSKKSIESFSTISESDSQDKNKENMDVIEPINEDIYRMDSHSSDDQRQLSSNHINKDIHPTPSSTSDNIKNNNGEIKKSIQRKKSSTKVKPPKPRKSKKHSSVVVYNESANDIKIVADESNNNNDDQNQDDKINPSFNLNLEIVKKEEEVKREIHTERSSTTNIKGSEKNLKQRKTSGTQNRDEKNVRINSQGIDEKKVSNRSKLVAMSSSVELKRKFSAKKIKKTSMSSGNLNTDIKKSMKSTSMPETEIIENNNNDNKQDEDHDKKISFLKIINESKCNILLNEDSMDMFDFLKSYKPPTKFTETPISKKKKEKETKEMKEHKKQQKLKDIQISKFVELCIKNTINEEQILSKIENKKLVKMYVNEELEPLVVDGPNPEDNSCSLPTDLPENIHCISVSTYPFLPTKPNREGSPICDSYHVRLFDSGFAIVTICDGCNWGKGPRDAAIIAKRTFSEYIEKNVKQLKDIKKTAKVLIRAVYMAHYKIIEGKQDIWDAGTTTFLGGILTQEQQQKDDYLFVFISVGDCKALIYDGKHVRDATFGNRQNASNPCDPGGRIGPYVKDGLPDMRNLKIDVVTLKKDEYLLLTSDGVSDNFDPEQLGLLPSEVGIHNVEGDNWKKVEKAVAMHVKSKFAIAKMEEVLNKATHPFVSRGKVTPSKILSHALVRHCSDSTYNGRRWMENNPTLPLPTDYKNYPGKMDHTSVVVVRVDESFSVKKTTKKNFLQQMNLRRSFNVNQN